MPTAVLGNQRQLRQRPHRPVRTQNRIGQLEHRIRPGGQTVIEPLPEPAKVPERPTCNRIVHTDHRQPWLLISSLDKKNDRPKAVTMITRGHPTTEPRQDQARRLLLGLARRAGQAYELLADRITAAARPSTSARRWTSLECGAATLGVIQVHPFTPCCWSAIRLRVVWLTMGCQSPYPQRQLFGPRRCRGCRPRAACAALRCGATALHS